MNRREFLLSSGTVALAMAAPSTISATVLYGDRSVWLDKARLEGGNLWVRAADLPRINEFTLKPQGACREDVCIPVSKNIRRGDWFNLTGFARKTGEATVSEAGVWSFGEIPLLRSSFVNSRLAPDFSAPDRTGRIVHLSDFRGKKVLVVTWASW
jgi:Peroxiredoxin